jgi:hypothetical protein
MGMDTHLPRGCTEICQLQEWHTKNLRRLPGLKWTLWVCNVSGGPFQFTSGTTSLGPEEAHRDLRIPPAEFDKVSAELGGTLDFFKVPKREKAEVLAAFAAQKDEVTAGYVAVAKLGWSTLGFRSKRSRPASAGQRSSWTSAACSSKALGSEIPQWEWPPSWGHSPLVRSITMAQGTERIRTVTMVRAHYLFTAVVPVEPADSPAMLPVTIDDAVIIRADPNRRPVPTEAEGHLRIRRSDYKRARR